MLCGQGIGKRWISRSHYQSKLLKWYYAEGLRPQFALGMHEPELLQAEGPQENLAKINCAHQQCHSHDYLILFYQQVEVKRLHLADI